MDLRSSSQCAFRWHWGILALVATARFASAVPIEPPLVDRESPSPTGWRSWRKTCGHPGQSSFSRTSGFSLRHSPGLRGAIQSSLVDGVWKVASGNDDDELIDVITNGRPMVGMMGFRSVLQPEEIRAIVAYLRAQEPRR